MENILRNAFYEETDEVFQEIEDCLLEIDSQGSTKTRIDNLFRYVHTLKGSSATMGIEDMAKLTHHLEDVMGKARDGDFELTKEMVSWIFSCLDELRIKVDKHKKDETYEIDVEKFIYSPKLSFTDAKNNGDINKTPNTPSGQQDTGGIKLLNLEERIYKIKIGLRPDSELVGARLYVVLDRLKKEGRIHSTSWEGIEPEEVEGQKFEIVFVSQLMRKEIEELILEVSNIEKIDIAEIDKPNKEENRGHGEEGIQSVIRVSIDKLDKLLRIVEELSVDKERLKQVMGAVEQKYGKDGDVKNLVKLVKQIDFIGNEMQETVMSTRMYTLDSVFRRFPRMVRDLSIKQGKEIELELEGESTELDRSIIEKIVDPLTHIVRNSIDHGIEKPDEREQCGKNRRGIIKLSAGQEDGHIYISAKDDGRGIEIEKLKQNAIKKGLLTRDDIDALTEKEVLEIIFMPGFSTTEKVTDISGRGVGMNVVRDNIEKINGIIDINNVRGQGLAITFKLPLTLAIIQSLLIKTGKCRFALPLLSIIEILRIKECEYEEKVRFANGKEILNWRGEILPIIRICDLFDTGKECSSSALGDLQRQKSFVGIVIGFSTSKIILGIEEVIGQQQVVIKPLERFTGRDNILGELRGISGTAILGDGGIAYVLDVQTLVKEMSKRK